MVKARPIAPYFREWKQEALEEACAASGRLCDTIKWNRAVEKKARVKLDDAVITSSNSPAAKRVVKSADGL